jgi:hypothetical protein
VAPAVGPNSASGTTTTEDHLGFVDLGSRQCSIKARAGANNTRNVEDSAASSADEVVVPADASLVQGGTGPGSGDCDEPHVYQRAQDVVDGTAQHRLADRCQSQRHLVR